MGKSHFWWGALSDTKDASREFQATTITDIDRNMFPSMPHEELCSEICLWWWILFYKDHTFRVSWCISHVSRSDDNRISNSISNYFDGFMARALQGREGDRRGGSIHFRWNSVWSHIFCQPISEEEKEAASSLIGWQTWQPITARFWIGMHGFRKAKPMVPLPWSFLSRGWWLLGFSRYIFNTLVVNIL